MRSKPTPGPYTVKEVFESYVVCSPAHATIAIFTADNGMEMDEAEANARAWVEGREAMETLKKIRTAMASVSFGQRALEVRDIILSIIEAKP